jgi:hypothetical protein
MRINKLLLHQIGSFQQLALDFPVGKDAKLVDVYLLTRSRLSHSASWSLASL